MLLNRHLPLPPAETVTTVKTVLAALLLCLAVTPVLRAHHSPASAYRTGERATVEGTIVSIVLRSPHSYLEVEAPDRSRHMRVWAVECGDSRTVRAHIAEGTLRPGDRVVVTGEPARDDGQWRVRLLSLVRPSDGWQWHEVVR